MNVQQFLDHLDRRGADLSTWPDADRRAARELVAHAPEAAAALQAAASVERHLATLRDHQAPLGLATRIAASISGRAGPGWLERLLTPLWRPALLALVPLAAGFIVGVQPPVDANDLLPEHLLALAFDDSLYRSDLYLELDHEQP